MPDETQAGTAADKVSSFLALIATGGMIGFNVLASTGYIGGVLTSEVSSRYPTVITPAGWAFTIWLAIYVGLAAFSIYQLLPANLVRYRPVRMLYIASCILNCLWLWMWHSYQIAASVGVIAGLWTALLMLAVRFREPAPALDAVVGKATFGLYFGWVTAATLINLMVLLVSLDVGLSAILWNSIGAVMLLAATAAAILVRFRLRNFLFPLAIAWAATGVGVAQSGNTAIVVASAICLIVALLMAISFVMDKKGTAA